MRYTEPWVRLPAFTVGRHFRDRHLPLGSLLVGRPAVAGITERTPYCSRAERWLTSERMQITVANSRIPADELFGPDGDCNQPLVVEEAEVHRV
jgi:hypothetical protein